MVALEALLQQVRPGADFADELGPPVILGSWKDEPGPSTVFPPNPAVSLPSTLISFNSERHDHPIHTLVTPSSRTSHLFRPHPRSKRHPPNFHAYRDANPISDDESDDNSASSSETEEEVVVTSSLAGRTNITLVASENDDTANDNNIRFHGRSTTAGLVEATRIFKHMHIKETMSQMKRDASPTSPDNATVAQTRRPQFWAKPNWEFEYEGRGPDSQEQLQIFLEYLPPSDLADTLIDLYFKHTNLLFPLLHRPTFDRQWLGSRWSNDERVLIYVASRGDRGELDWRKAGRFYFDIAIEIHQPRWSSFHPAGLFEVQTFTLLSMYLRGTSQYPAAWFVTSVGIRKAQDVGAHRKRAYQADTTADNELWKRAFWHLVAFDRLGSTSLGRSCTVVEEDFDIDLLLEVDDEYWEGVDDRQPFTQPPDVPSLIESFNQFVKLTRVIAFATRTLYAVDRRKLYRGLAQVDRQSVVKQLIPALEAWTKNLPDHLRWKENMAPKFANEAASLAMIFHVVQILVYRPLIAPTSLRASSKSPLSELTPSPLSIVSDPAVERCLQAAHACARIVEVQLRQGIANFFVPGLINASYVSAAMLLWHAWNLKVREGLMVKAGLDVDIKPPIAQRVEEDLADTKVFMAALEEVRPRWDAVDLLLEELKASLPGLESRVSTHEVPITEPYSDPTQSYWMGPDQPQSEHRPLYSAMPPPTLPPPSPPSQQPLARPSLYASSKFSHSMSDLSSASAAPARPSLNVQLSDSNRTPKSHGHRQPQSAGAAEQPLHSLSPAPVPQPMPPPPPPAYPPPTYPASNPPTHAQPHAHGRTRSSSVATIPMALTSHERGMPLISSSMRRTSVPNMAAAARSSQIQTLAQVRSQPLVSAEPTLVRFEDVNMHFEGSPQASSSQYGTYNLQAQDGHSDKLSLRTDAWGGPAGISGQWTGPIASSPVSPHFYTHHNHSASSLNIMQGSVPIYHPFG
ncbi:unnamed protein product [Cyclocybe aegerita]|uniref:Xylanolytic transcriptional activator regulatory domain-containing protein n=1 Tax=Cyclocybe aegerita TaxID=1973307 RepID=A0A8S0W8R6_CYCAE|nr:unnamed protein product [Cyclocybe aegerita]